MNQYIIGQARFERYGSSVTIAIAGGFAINLLLARLTRFKYIYLTGHVMFWTTMIFAGVMGEHRARYFSGAAPDADANGDCGSTEPTAPRWFSPGVRKSPARQRGDGAYFRLGRALGRFSARYLPATKSAPRILKFLKTWFSARFQRGDRVNHGAVVLYWHLYSADSTPPAAEILAPGDLVSYIYPSIHR